jgi:hemin uptake protein HemP
MALGQGGLQQWAILMNQMTSDPVATTTATPEVFPTYHAEDLTRGGIQARILLNGQIYSLRITRAGKLILTK